MKQKGSAQIALESYIACTDVIFAANGGWGEMVLNGTGHAISEKSTNKEELA
jgi:hypothetical protein